MRDVRWRTAGLGVFLIALAGCGQALNIDKTVELETGDIIAPALIDAPKKEQKIKVEFTSSASAINVYIVLGDEKAVLKELEKAAPKLVDLVGSKEKSKDGAVEATIPSGKEYGVYLSGAMKKTQVTLKIKSQ